MHYDAGGGRSRRSPGMSAGTARRSGPIWTGNGRSGNGPRPAATRSPRSSTYCTARLVEDPHLWATALHDEVVKLGYQRSYPAFTRALRLRGLRPACEPCHPAKGRPAAVIEHPAGVETQWDWVELPDPPAGWDGYGKRAYLLVGALSHSSKWRGVLCESMNQPQLAEAQHQVAAKLGGVTTEWRFDRMATVVHPGSGQVTATYAPIAKHFGVIVRPCPPRRGNRKGVVEKANHTAAQRWWRTLPDEVTAAQAQASLDEFCATVTDQRARTDQTGNRCTVADLAAAEPLRPVPTAPPVAVITVTRKVSAQALVSFRGNTYSVPPAHAGQPVSVTHRLGATTLSITTPAGVTIAVHHRRPDGAGVCVRTDSARHRVEHRRPGRVHHRRAAPVETADPTRPRRPRSSRCPARRTGRSLPVR